ncbi:MAG: hypothetical protein Ct9H90mP11_06450 [Acidimicrobiales bacterium]|nr:MAG: hypothetical protein Ct9H90mP11_06450 [Acidimicrobiales bacterium]
MSKKPPLPTRFIRKNNGEEINEGSPSTSTSVLHPPAEVRVLVANGTDVTGAAGATLDTLVANAGYNGVGAVNDPLGKRYYLKPSYITHKAMI